MAKSRLPSSATDDEVRALLARYQCPVPFHEVRTRFLGNIATPAMSSSPIKMVEDLWGGELPAFEAMDDVNELVGALIMGLWNRLTRHQDRNTPFRLLRVQTGFIPEGLAALSLMRKQEIEGFIQGLFGEHDEISLPERAHQALDDLGEMRARFEAAHTLAMGDAKDAVPKNIEQTIKHIGDMTKIAEHAMHKIVLLCKRARGQMLSGLIVHKPTLH